MMGLDILSLVGWVGGMALHSYKVGCIYLNYLVLHLFLNLSSYNLLYL